MSYGWKTYLVISVSTVYGFDRFLSILLVLSKIKVNVKSVLILIENLLTLKYLLNILKENKLLKEGKEHQRVRFEFYLFHPWKPSNMDEDVSRTHVEKVDFL